MPTRGNRERLWGGDGELVMRTTQRASETGKRQDEDDKPRDAHVGRGVASTQVAVDVRDGGQDPRHTQRQQELERAVEERRLRRWRGTTRARLGVEEEEHLECHDPEDHVGEARGAGGSSVHHGGR